MKATHTFFLSLLMLLVYSCSRDDDMPYLHPNPQSNHPGFGEQDCDPDPTGGGGSDWLIPEDQVLDGGPGQDGIPALDNPDFITAGEAKYLSGDDLVLGYKKGSIVRAYPHRILDWHEIVNDKVSDLAFAVHYCPLTGTGIGWNRTIHGTETTFGVSGLLYNSNLILFDRDTETYWSQIRLEAVHGQWAGTEAEVFQLVETRWDTWKKMYPETMVLSTETGYDRNYSHSPYGDYSNSHDFFLFPFQPDDPRLDSKKRVHGVIINGEAKAYRLSSFHQNNIIEDAFQGKELIIAGTQDQDFIVSYYRELPDGTILDFLPVQHDLPVILEDTEGNRWNIFGEAISGPRQGQRLRATTSFMGYWFAWGAFYCNLDIF